MRATEGAEETNYRNKEQREQRTQKRKEHHRKTWAERDSSGTRTVKREEDRKGRRDGGHRTHALTDSEVTNRMSHGR